MKALKITNYASFKNGILKVDNKVIAENKAGTDFSQYYELLHLDYPKFYKMDNLSKLAVLTCEKLLAENTLLNRFEDYEKGIIFSSADGSLDTDEKYFNSTQTLASPALFVYTLPNIAVGELSIRHKFKGETATFIFDKFNPDFLADYIQILYEERKIKCSLGGWANFYAKNAEAFFYLACESESGLAHTSKNIQNIYNQSWMI